MARKGRLDYTLNNLLGCKIHIRNQVPRCLFPGGKLACPVEQELARLAHCLEGNVLVYFKIGI